MTQPNFKDELLKQNGHSALDQEVTKLHRLVEAEQRRARRLTFWTIFVWSVWMLMVALSIGMPIVQYQRLNAGPRTLHATTVPSDQPPTPAQLQAQQARVAEARAHAARTTALLGSIAGVLLIVLFLVLPFVGIVLLILMILARRSASLTQIRASLASIDVQLRLALAQRGPTEAGGETKT